MKPFAELSHISIHRGIFDQILGVGDVVFTCDHRGGLTICDIKDYKRVFNMTKKLQTDIYSDTMYPNALRPAENPGYNTKYKLKEEDI